MKSKNYLIIALALTTLGGAALAWRQYQELVELRAAAMDSSERSDLQKRIADLEKANKELRDQLAAGRGERDDNTDMAADTPDQGNGGPGQNGNGRGQNRRAQFAQVGAAIRELMAKPEMQAMVNSERKATLDAQYAALFQKLNLSPDQADKLKDLLVQRQDAQRDVFQAARDQGINPRTDPQGFQKLVSDAESPINDSIKSLLGDSGYDQLNNYDQTMPQRNIVNMLQQKLSYTDSPLSSTQADQLVQVLATNAPQKNPTTGTTDTNNFGGNGRIAGMLMGGFGGGPGGGGGGETGMMSLVGRNAAPITSQAVNQAQTVLTPTQVSALQQLQQQQQTAQQIQQLIRTTAQQAQQAAGASAPAAGSRKGGGG